MSFRGWLLGLLPFALAAGSIQCGSRVWIVSPREDELKGIQAEAARLEIGLARPLGDDSSKNPEAARALENGIEAAEERVRALQSVFSARAEADALLHSLTSLASDAGLAVQRFAPAAAYRLDAYIAYPATLDAEGQYFDFLEFFEAVSALPRLVLVEELDLQGPPDQAGALRGRLLVLAIGGNTESADRNSIQEAPIRGSIGEESP